MTDLINTDDHTTEHKVTADEVKINCPVMLQDSAKHIAAHFDKARRCEEKAEQHYTAISQYLADVERTCDEGGFKAFREKFFPELGKSRVHELLQIASGKKSIQQTRASTRERVAKHRAKKATGSVTVTEKSGSAGYAEDATIPTELTRDPERPRSTVNPKDEALLGFSAAVLELNRRTKGTKPEHFAATSVSPDELARLGKYLSDLSNLKIRSRPSKTARPKVSAPPNAANDMAA